MIIFGCSFLTLLGETFGNNLKISNILLDYNSNIKLSDYVAGDIIACLVSGAEDDEIDVNSKDRVWWILIKYEKKDYEWCDLKDCC